MVNRAFHDARQLMLIETLRATRKHLHLSQAALAAKLGKRQQFVSKYESGERHLDFIEVVDVARILGLTVQALLQTISNDDADS